MRSALLAAPASGATDNDALTAMCDAIAAAVVAHITSAGVVTIPPGVPVATTGTAAAQAGATTAPAVGTIA
jgi:hypothetical protein